MTAAYGYSQCTTSLVGLSIEWIRRARPWAILTVYRLSMGNDFACVSDLSNGALPVSCGWCRRILLPYSDADTDSRMIGTCSSCTAKEYEARASSPQGVRCREVRVRKNGHDRIRYGHGDNIKVKIRCM